VVCVGFAHTPAEEAFNGKRATKKAAARKPAAKRELIAPRGDKRYIRRDAQGRIKESDDVSRSLSQDRRRKAKTAAKAGQGDRGDRKPAAKSPARKSKRAKR
jgi:hypothetical protein